MKRELAAGIHQVASTKAGIMGGLGGAARAGEERDQRVDAGIDGVDPGIQADLRFPKILAEGLHLPTDGVHLPTDGMNILADLLTENLVVLAQPPEQIEHKARQRKSGGDDGGAAQPVQPLQGRSRSSPSEQRFMRLKASIMSVMSWPGQTMRNPWAARSSASLGLLVT